MDVATEERARGGGSIVVSNGRVTVNIGFWGPHDGVCNLALLQCAVFVVRR